MGNDGIFNGLQLGKSSIDIPHAYPGSKAWRVHWGNPLAFQCHPTWLEDFPSEKRHHKNESNCYV